MTTCNVDVISKFFFSTILIALLILLLIALFFRILSTFKQYCDNIDNCDILVTLTVMGTVDIVTSLSVVKRYRNSSQDLFVLRCSLSIAAEGFPVRLLPAGTTSEPSLRDICRQQVCPPDMTVNSKKKHPSQSTVDKREKPVMSKLR